MDQGILQSTLNHRDQWLALLDHHGVGCPKALHVLEVPEGLVRATIGEPPGRLALDGAPANVLMFNMSPVQALRQTREGRSFVSDMLHGEMTLMPCGVPSLWFVEQFLRPLGRGYFTRSVWRRKQTRGCGSFPFSRFRDSGDLPPAVPRTKPPRRERTALCGVAGDGLGSFAAAPSFHRLRRHPRFCHQAD
jgi:hypothetical protein